MTVTTAVGFLSNLVSPIPPIREFGLLVPALKIEIDGALEARGIDRRAKAFGPERARKEIRGETLAPDPSTADD